MKMLESIGMKDLRGKHAVVIGRSDIIGKAPMAMMLLAANATVTICHSGTADLAAMTRQADIVVAAVGKRNVLTADMLKPGAVVIDVGMNRDDAGKLSRRCRLRRLRNRGQPHHPRARRCRPQDHHHAAGRNTLEAARASQPSNNARHTLAQTLVAPPRFFYSCNRNG